MQIISPQQSVRTGFRTPPRTGTGTGEEGKLGIMDFSEVLRGRRMVRHYRPEPIPEDVLQRIVRVVRRAPSGGFSQGHRLVVITDPAARARIAAIAEPPYLEMGFQPWISQAPVHIALGIREASYHERYQEPDKLLADGTEMTWPVPYWWFDSGCLFMLLQLAAVAEGLAVGFFNSGDPETGEGLRAEIGFPDDVALSGMLTIGYPAENPETGPTSRVAKRRLPLEDLVTWRR